MHRRRPDAWLVLRWTCFFLMGSIGSYIVWVANPSYCIYEEHTVGIFNSLRTVSTRNQLKSPICSPARWIGREPVCLNYASAGCNNRYFRSWGLSSVDQVYNVCVASSFRVHDHEIRRLQIEIFHVWQIYIFILSRRGISAKILLIVNTLWLRKFWRSKS